MPKKNTKSLLRMDWIKNKWVEQYKDNFLKKKKKDLSKWKYISRLKTGCYRFSLTS